MRGKWGEGGRQLRKKERKYSSSSISFFISFFQNQEKKIVPGNKLQSDVGTMAARLKLNYLRDKKVLCGKMTGVQTGKNIWPSYNVTSFHKPTKKPREATFSDAQYEEI